MGRRPPDRPRKKITPFSKEDMFQDEANDKPTCMICYMPLVGSTKGLANMPPRGHVHHVVCQKFWLTCELNEKGLKCPLKCEDPATPFPDTVVDSVADDDKGDTSSESPGLHTCIKQP